MRADTALVSVMAVNNEIGVLQPIAEIGDYQTLIRWWGPYNVAIPGELCRSRKIFFHTDAAQAVGKVPIDVNSMKIDLLSISGHKVYGPKGLKNEKKKSLEK